MTWDNETRILSAKVSDVGGWLSQYTLISHVTGRKVMVEFVHREYEAERGLLWRDYKPINAGLLDFTLRVFND
jgi:hypothetical protein